MYLFVIFRLLVCRRYTGIRKYMVSNNGFLNSILHGQFTRQPYSNIHKYTCNTWLYVSLHQFVYIASVYMYKFVLCMRESRCRQYRTPTYIKVGSLAFQYSTTVEITQAVSDTMLPEWSANIYNKLVLAWYIKSCYVSNLTLGWISRPRYSTWLHLMLFWSLDHTLCIKLRAQHSLPCENYSILNKYMYICTYTYPWRHFPCCCRGATFISKWRSRSHDGTSCLFSSSSSIRSLHTQQLSWLKNDVARPRLPTRPVRPILRRERAGRKVHV